MSGEVWPPPAGPDTVWRTVRVRYDAQSSELVRLRRVVLWGESVECDSEGAIWCNGCNRTIPWRELAVPGHGHRVGLHRGRLVTVFAPTFEHQREGGGFDSDDDGPDAA